MKVRSHKRSRREEGFTLIELAVATVAGATVIASTYFIGSSSARFLSEQQRVARSQMDARMALERLRGDIERAGYLGTGYSAQEQTCAAADATVQAVWYDYADSTVTDAIMPYPTENRVRVDRLRLTGNYATNDSYLASSLAADGSRIYLQQTWQAFNRSFSDGAGGISESVFEGAFAAERMIHLETPAGKHYFKIIQSSEHSTASIQFATPISVGDTTNQRCLSGFGESARVSPLSRIEYYVGDITGGASGLALANAAGMPDSNPAQLIRQELEFDTNNAIANTAMSVAEYVAGFAINWIIDTNTTAGGTPTLDRLKGADAETALNTNPQRARTAILMLALRNPEDSSHIKWPYTAEAGWVRPATSPFDRYLVRKDLVSATNRGFAARVRTARATATLHSLTARGLK